jgi:hypothetical protein
MMKTFSRTIFDKLKRHPFIFSFLVSIPSLYFSLLGLFGKTIGIYDATEKLKTPVYVCTTVIVIISFSIAFLRALGEKYDTELQKNGMLILSKLVKTNNNIKESKFHYYSSFISDYTKESICKHLAPFHEMKKQINEFRIDLAEILGIESNRVGISLIYQLDSDQYNHISSSNVSINLPKLLSNPKSTISIMRREQLSLLFFADKQLAIKENKYIPGKKDEFYQNIGSIFSKNISINTTHRSYVNAYLSITTYGMQICTEDDIFTKSKFSELIIPVLEDQIKVELTKLYIEQKKKCPNRT